MNIIIHTMNGTYIVSPEKERDLIGWLEVNATKAGTDIAKQKSEKAQYGVQQLNPIQTYATINQ